jgi:hypothetical protein
MASGNEEDLLVNLLFHGEALSISSLFYSKSKTKRHSYLFDMEYYISVIFPGMGYDLPSTRISKHASTSSLVLAILTS